MYSVETIDSTSEKIANNLDFRFFDCILYFDARNLKKKKAFDPLNQNMI